MKVYYVQCHNWQHYRIQESDNEKHFNKLKAYTKVEVTCDLPSKQVAQEVDTCGS